MRSAAIFVAALVSVGLIVFFAWRGFAPGDDVLATAPHPTAPEPAARTSETPSAEVVVPSAAESADAGERALAATSREPATAPASGDGGAETTIVGRCVDFDGRPIAGVRIGKRRARTVDAETDEAGRFRILCDAETARGSSVTLRASGPRIVADVREIALAARRENDSGDWRLERGGLLAGRVLDSARRPVADARVVTTRGYDVVLEDARRQELWSGEADTRTDASGAFELEAVKPGRVRVWALKSRYFNGLGEAFELRVDEEVRGLELVLEPEPPEDGVDLQVLLPDGSPCPDPQVTCEYAATNMSGSTYVPCDEQGRGHFRLVLGARHEFRAVDRERRFGEAVAAGVERGHPPIVLKLGSAEPTVLLVVDEAGTPLEAARAMICRLQDGVRSCSGARRGHDDAPGRFTFAAPSILWAVEVSAPGFDDLELGPYEPDAAPKELLAKLKRKPGLVGRVFANGQPVANATVHEGRAVESNTVLVVNDFPADRDFRSGSNVTTDADGRFVLYPEQSGEILLRAEAPTSVPGFAPTIVGPLAYDRERGEEGVDVELVHGGALEGRVLLPAGESAAGTIVGASCGDGFAQTTRTGADGAYRFERLTPGRWLVKRCDDEISPNSTTSTSSSGDEEVPEAPWNVLVPDGVTVHFDLDLRLDTRPHARGRLSIGGRPLAGWIVGTHTRHDAWNEDGNAVTNERGEFDVYAPSPGPGSLALRRRLDAQETRSALLETEWGPRELVLEHDFPGGRVQLSRAPSNDGPNWFELATTDAATKLQWELRVQLAPGVTRTLDDVPAGEWTVKPIGAAAGSVYDTLKVSAGDTATYAVP